MFSLYAHLYIFSTYFIDTCISGVTEMTGLFFDMENYVMIKVKGL